MLLNHKEGAFMKKLIAILLVLILVLSACSNAKPAEKPDNSLPEESKSNAEFSEDEFASKIEKDEEFSEEDYEKAVKELGYTEERLSYFEGLFYEGLSPLAVMDPLKYCKAFGEPGRMALHIPLEASILTRKSMLITAAP